MGEDIKKLSNTVKEYERYKENMEKRKGLLDIR